VRPSLEAVTAAAASAQLPDDLRASITNAPGGDAYPIASFTYLLFYKDQAEQAKGKALAEFLWWAIHDGQKEAARMLYAPLPGNVVDKAEQIINSISFEGQILRR
jgi:phosphate transport system substrate-binding protein